MASLRKRRNKWYARVSTWQGSKRKEKLIPLRTSRKVAARERLIEVQRVENDIKNGEEFVFPWMSNEPFTKVVRKTVSDIIDKYHNDKFNNGVKQSTIDRSVQSINRLTDIIGDIPIEDIGMEKIDTFKQFYLVRHKPNTININLGKIRAFLNWCEEKDIIRKAPRIKLVKAPTALPKYVSDSNFNKIMKAETVEYHFRQAFYFYRETGCRKAEPFYGQLDGEWLILHPDNTKTNRTREIELTAESVIILKEMQSRFKSLPYQQKSIIDRYSKEFKKACREVGLDHNLHNLRDTYAVKLWLKNRDIYLVSKLIGHASVTMTEKYANFNPKRLVLDFPTLTTDFENGQNRVKIGEVDTVSVDTHDEKIQNSENLIVD